MEIEARKPYPKTNPEMKMLAQAATVNWSMSALCHPDGITGDKHQKVFSVPSARDEFWRVTVELCRLADTAPKNPILSEEPTFSL